MTTKIDVCGADEVPAGEAQEFSLSRDGRTLELFIVQQDGRYHAYQNSCPHTGAPLNWQPHQFLDLEQRHIQCGIHGALFRIHDGVCIWGPCQGQSLSALPLQEREGRLWLEW